MGGLQRNAGTAATTITEQPVEGAQGHQPVEVPLRALNPNTRCGTGADIDVIGSGHFKLAAFPNLDRPRGGDSVAERDQVGNQRWRESGFMGLMTRRRCELMTPTVGRTG